MTPPAAPVETDAYAPAPLTTSAMLERAPDLVPPAPATATAVPEPAEPMANAAPTATPVPAPVLSVGEQALAMVSYPWQNLGYRIEFHDAVRGLRGLTYPYENRIEIYVRSDDTPAGLAHVVAHEIGHAVDVVLNSGQERTEWLIARGLPTSHPWWPGEGGLADFATGSGDFAECFASWQIGSPSFSEIGGDCHNHFDLMAQLASG